MARGPLLCFFLLALFPYAERVEAAVPPSARQALIALYDSTGGDTWLDQEGWLGSSGTECRWIGITCDDSGGAIIRITLARNNLSGELPDAIGDLTSLGELDLSGNRLTGLVPSSIHPAPGRVQGRGSTRSSLRSPPGRDRRAPWIVPVTESVNIPPGETALIE